MKSNEQAEISEIADPNRSRSRSRLLTAPAVGAAPQSLVFKAYQEYCERCDAGEVMDPDAFCAAHPTVQSSLAKLVHVHQFLEDRPDLTEDDNLAWPTVGETFLDYQLVMELGRGAFASVYLALETKLGNRLVAVKIASDGAATEADILGRVNHPNIVPVHSTSRDRLSGLTLVCMPYVGSATLHAVLDRLKALPRPPATAAIILHAAQELAHPLDPSAHPVAPTRVLQRGTYLDGLRWLGMQLADSLAYLHERGICHLDLKPSNVLLSPDGTPMLLDFNLSSNQRKGHLRQGGTVPYMSPEQLRTIVAQEDPRTIDARSDLFSLGVILYELATGVHPFGPIPLTASTPELARQLIERQQSGCVPVRQRNPEVDATFARLIERCLSFDATQRPRGAEEVAGTLRRQLTPAPRVRRWIGRNRWKSIAAALIFLALGSSVIAAVAMRPPASERHYATGLDWYQKGDNERAIESFDAAVQADPALAAAYFARGRAYQKSAAVDKTKQGTAIRNFEQAQKLAPDGRNLAAIAYSETCLSSFGAALLMYERAAESGFVSAELYNNMGYCHWKLNKPQEARKCFDKAIDMDAALQAPRCNRATLLTQEMRNEIRKSPGPDKIRDRLYSALQVGHGDLQKAIESGPANAELSYGAACFYSAASHVDEKWKANAVRHLIKAVDEQGFDPTRLATDAGLIELRTDNTFLALSKRGASGQPEQRLVRFVDPIKDAVP